jgi:hypothetical protein
MCLQLCEVTLDELRRQQAELARHIASCKCT